MEAGLHPDEARAESEEKTCASEYPEQLTQAPKSYPYKSQTKAWNRFFDEASKLYLGVKMGKRARNEGGLCPNRGRHINIVGHPRKPSKGKRSKAENIGSLTSCEICSETDQRPKLQEAWRFNKRF